MPGPKADSARTEAIITSAPLRSCERATWPFLRASSRRLGVAFSVLSPPLPAIARHLLRDPKGVEGLTNGLGELGAEPPRHERQRDADQQEADEDLGREA